jgi:aminopeptidase
MDKKLLKEYAQLVVEQGMAVRPGQLVVVLAYLGAAEFVRYVAEAAYDCGARDVVVKWSDETVERLHWLRADESVFKAMDPWEVDEYNSYGERNTAALVVRSSDPLNSAGADPKRYEMWGMAQAAGMMKCSQDRESGRLSFCCVGAPAKSWAKSIFPELSDEDAVEKLWQGIVTSARIEEGKTKDNWDKHVKELAQRCEKLNEYHFESLQYKNSIGTDLTVKLPKAHLWTSGRLTLCDGSPFLPNIPTEEVWTAPLRDGANGILYSTRPIFCRGSIVEGIRLELKDGRIVNYSAKNGGSILRNLIEINEHSHYLGEVALVPYSSPIRRSGIIYHDTTFDENASCHFAIGSAYAWNIEGGTNMSVDELRAAGINAAAGVHVDFMVGSEDLSIAGTTEDGRRIPIMVNGEFTPEFE